MPSLGEPSGANWGICRGLSLDVPDAGSLPRSEQTTPVKVTATHEEYVHAEGMSDGNEIVTKFEIPRGDCNV